MKKDNEKKASFIPCGDSFEKMEEIFDKELEEVTGGISSDDNGDTDGFMGGSMLR